MNWYAVRAIYVFEMARMGRTLFQSIVSPVISTSLYFVVFGAAIGSRITEIDGVSYDHAFPADGERIQRIVWNLFSQVCRLNI
jgi:hypothetical protein